jgi:hypothetical protein
MRWRRHGRVLIVSVGRGHGRRIRLRLTETIRVRGHRESFSFTKIYRSC